MLRFLLTIFTLLGCASFTLAGCSSDTDSSDVSEDVGMLDDSGPSDLQEADADSADPPDRGFADVRSETDQGADLSVDAHPDLESIEFEPENYCELTVDFFCDYYMRCGRIVADDLQDCRVRFLETCNAVYEPVYRAYASAGVLELSEDGMAQCETHLSSVACERQLFDLDAGCSRMWQGQVDPGGACAPGIGSFVCGEESSCRIGLDLCGTCEAGAAPGEPCGEEARCISSAACVDGMCVERGLPGDACDDERRCVVGARCESGTCEGFETVAVGQACDQARRCPYGSECRQGECVASGMLNDACEDRGCASGFCDDGVCQPMRDGLEGCSEGVQCLSGRCNGQFCEPLVSECLSMN